MLHDAPTQPGMTWLDEPRPPRVEGGARVIARTRRGLVRCTIRNLSLTGVYVYGVTAPVDREVRLWLDLPGEAEPIAVRGRVVRTDEAPKAVALTFSGIGWDDMLSIARYLAPRI